MRITNYLLLTALLFLTADAVAQSVISIEPEEINFGEVGIRDSRNVAVTVTNVRHEDEMVIIAQAMGQDSLRYLCLVPEAEAARETIIAIRSAILMFEQDYGEEPITVSHLVQLGYIEIDEEVDRQWDFTLIGSSPITQIEAVSTNEMPFGAGHTILYDYHTRQFSGYNFEEQEVVLELDVEQSLTFTLQFTPVNMREYSDSLVFFVFNRDPFEQIEEVTVDVSGTGVHPDAVGIEQTHQPSDFGISATYPNPFNSTTTLSYSLSGTSDVTIAIYDINGLLITTLLNGNQSAGDHSLLWNAENTSAGIYFVRMETDGFSDTRKIVLVK